MSPAVLHSGVFTGLGARTLLSEGCTGTSLKSMNTFMLCGSLLKGKGFSGSKTLLNSPSATEHLLY